jgi:hypothetical protein
MFDTPECQMKGIHMKKSICTVAIAMTLILLLFSAATVSRAQSNDATLTGIVVDKTGAVIPGASIVVTDEASGVARSTTSDGRGFFSLVGVPVATYDVKVSATGFNSLLRKGVVVHINDQIELKGITLSVSGNSTSIVVTAEPDEMTPTTSGEVSYTISDTQLHNMDIEGRSAIELLGLVPGSGNTGNFNGPYNSASAGFTQNSSSFTVNGNRFDQVALVSDGASVSDLNTAGSAAVTPNVDMISELKVESSAYSSAQPNGPVVVSTETKSGGRTFHGLAELTARNHALNAADWQQKYNGLPAPQTSLLYPQLQLGGPVPAGHSWFKDKLFFFAASEISQQHVDLLPRKSQVPAVAGSPGYTGAGMANGDFGDSTYLSALSNSGNSWLGWPVASNPCSSSNTLNGEAFWNYCSNNASGSWGQINSSVIDPGGQILLNALPHPNEDPSLHDGYNLITDFTVSQPRNQEILKLDFAVTDSTHFSARYNHENESVPSPYGPWNMWNQVPYPAAQTQKNASNSLDLNLNSALSSRLTNEASFGYTRFTLQTALSGLDAVSSTALKYPYANLFTSSSDLLPNVSFEKSVGGLYIAGGEAPTYLGAQNNITFNDGLTLLKGTHLLRAGFYVQVARYNLLTNGNDNGSVDTQNYDAVTKNDWADLLIGNVSNFSQTSGNLKANMAANRFDFYLQDTWKLSSKLTVNYGLRVDHIGWWYDKNGHIAVFNPSADTSAATANYADFSGMESHATNSAVPLSGSKPLGFQLAPSVGFAYDLSGGGRTILRGGFGTNYYSDPGINAYSAIMAPPSFQVVSSWAGSTPYTLKGVSALSPSSVPPTVWGSADPSDHRAPVTYSWNLALSHLFWGANKVEANYVGNSSHNLVGYGIQNAVPEGSETGPWYGTWLDETLRPYLNFGDISTHFHNLNSTYNALQLTVTRQKGWLNYWGSYTFGKTLAYNAEDAFDMKRWYGPTPFDRSQILSFSYYLNLPGFGSKYLGGNRLAKAAADGWKISGIFQAMTGGPIQNATYNGSEYAANLNTIGIYGTVSNTVGGQTNSNISLSSNGGAFADGTPDEIAVPKMVCDPRKGLAKNQYFNPACFVAPSYLENGTYRLPYIHGPAYINDSIGLFKAFAMGESRKLEVRGEAFNLFNHPWNEFIQYDPNMYLSFNAAGGANQLATAGTADNKTGHRELSLAAKFYF